MPPRPFRVILPMPDLDRDEALYDQLLGIPGGRGVETSHYYHCGETTSPWSTRPSTILIGERPRIISTLPVPDLEGTFQRAKDAGCDRLDEEISTRPFTVSAPSRHRTLREPDLLRPMRRHSLPGPDPLTSVAWR